jgi:hypothetical protein
MSGWGSVDEKFEPVERRLGSSLLVLSGQINEQGPLGAHFFTFDGALFHHVKTIEMEPDFRKPLAGASARAG